VVDVVREPDGDAALRRGDERALDDRLQVVREVEVVDRDLERALRAGEVVGERVRGALGRLRAVRERLELDQDASARIRALWTRFASW
jgi:predicted RNA-binding protein associated with RNAse of E/G family